MFFHSALYFFRAASSFFLVKSALKSPDNTTPVPAVTCSVSSFATCSISIIMGSLPYTLLRCSCKASPGQGTYSWISSRFFCTPFIFCPTNFVACQSAPSPSSPKCDGVLLMSFPILLAIFSLIAVSVPPGIFFCAHPPVSSRVLINPQPCSCAIAFLILLAVVSLVRVSTANRLVVPRLFITSVSSSRSAVSAPASESAVKCINLSFPRSLSFVN